MRNAVTGLGCVVMLATVLATAQLLAGCGGGGGAGGGFRVLKFSGSDRPAVSLNEPLTIMFSEPVKPSSLGERSVRIRMESSKDVPIRGDLVRGSIRDGRLDASRKQVVTFFPAPPNLVDLSDAGLRPGTRYMVVLPAGGGGDRVRSRRGVPLRLEYRSRFETVSAGSSPLFADHAFPGGPDVVGISPPSGAHDVSVTTSIRLTFSEPLLPSTVLAGDAEDPGIVLRDISMSPPQPVAVSRHLAQTWDSVTVTLNPLNPLEPGRVYQIVVVANVTDLAGHAVQPFVAPFSTGGSGVLDLDFLEDFETNFQEDFGLTTANWNNRRDTLVGGVPGRLTAVLEPGAGDGPVEPPPTTGTGVPIPSLGSTGYSTWFNTRRATPRFGEPTEVMALNGGTVVIEYQATHEDVITQGENPDLDPNVMTDWVPGPSIDTISNRQWIRFRVRFTVPVAHPIDDPLPEVDHILVPITF